MVIILEDFTSKITKKRYYKDNETNDFNSQQEKDLEKKGLVKIKKSTKELKQKLDTKTKK